MKIITITSGKGGVGKTNIAVNLAVSLVKKGYKTCLFDADIGLANVNILMGIVGRYSLKDVIDGSKALKDVMIKDWNGIDIIPGSTGVEQFENLDKKKLESLISEFSTLDDYDYIIVDTGAGISRSVVSFCLASSLLIVVIVPEPTSLTDAYSLLKILTFNKFQNSVNIVVNRSKSFKYGAKVFEKFNNTVSKYIKLKMNFLGIINEDEKVSDAVSNQSPFVIKYPDTIASKACAKLADNIINTEHESPYENKNLDSFIKTCSQFFQARLKLIKQGQDKKQIISTKDPDKNQSFKNTQFEQQVLTLLNKLVKSTEKLTKEIQDLKDFTGYDNTDCKTFEEINETQVINNNEDEVEVRKAPVLTLDFDKFVENKKLDDEKD